MILKNFFTPRWWRAAPKIRDQALEDVANDHELLLRMTNRTATPELRILSIERITDLVTLDGMARTDTDPQVRERALGRLQDVLSGTVDGPSLAERLVWIKEVSDPVLLAHLAGHGVESSLRSAVLERIDEDEVLAASAVADLDARVRALAAFRLQDRTLLERVAKLARNRDKRVYRVAQERLATIIEEEERPRRQRLIRMEFCADAEALARRGHWRDATTPLERLEDRWATAEGVADPDLAERFAAAVAIIRRGLAEEGQRQREQTRAEESVATLRAEKKSLCMALENLAADLAGRIRLESEDIAMARSLLRTIENGWTQGGKLPPAEDSQFNARFQAARSLIDVHFGDLLRHAEQLAAAVTQCERIEQLLVMKQAVEESTLDKWNREWQALGINSDSGEFEEKALTHRFQEVMRQLRELGRIEHERREHCHTQATALLIELEQALEEGKLKVATGILTNAQTAIEGMVADVRAAALKPRLEKCATTVRQLQEWQRWANAREYDRLCTEMEALVGIEETPERLAVRIREMRDAWNHLGPPEREAASLEGRFNSACEAAFEPCRIHFAEQARQREKAAKVREVLIARVEAFTTNVDWTTMDWKATDNFLQEMRAAWRDAGLVDRRAADLFQERFRIALEPIEQRVRQEHRRNLKAKEALIARAEAVRNEQDLRLAANEIKRIQSEWKTLGHVPRHKEQALWHRLRVAADDVFKRRRALVMAQETERNAARVAREELCEQIESLTRRINIEAAAFADEFTALEQQWTTLPVAARDDANFLDNRFRKAVTTYHEAVVALGHQQAHDAMATLVARGALCAELEALIETGDGDLQTMVEAARVRWNTLGKDDSALMNRFERACSRAELPQDQRRLPLRLDPQALEALEMICIRLEIFTGVESPPESARARLAHQVNRLAKGLGQGTEIGNQEQRRMQLMELLRTWYANGPLPIELRAVFDARLSRILTAAFQELTTHNNSSFER
ncbi:conserved hypothetical protein [Gammaproteobacteria bacterium]